MQRQQTVSSIQQVGKGEGREMRFAKVVFWVAAVWGFLVLTPLFFIFNLIGKNDPPAITHPGFYYGFASVGLAWQVAFAVIARDPVRLRPMMIPAMLEKFGYVIVVVTLYLQARMKAPDLLLAGLDGLLGVMFLVAWVKTNSAAYIRSEQTQISLPAGRLI
jgi:hypothetical protein